MENAKKVVLFLTILVAGMVCSSAYGEDTGTDKWEWSVTPYFWFAGVDGDVKSNGNKVDIDESFSDIWDALNFGGSVHIEAKKGKWGILIDTLYMDLSMDKDIVSPVTAEVDLEMWTVEVGGFYQIGEWPMGDGNGRNMRLDVLGGGRYWNLDTDVKIGLMSGSTDSDWIDPFIGLRLFVDMKDWLIFHARGDIGGFAVSSDAAELTWNVLVGPMFKLSEKLSIIAGYRWLDLDLEDGSNSETNVTYEGPMLGAVIRF